MAEKLCILVCDYFRKEVTKAVEAEGFDNVSVATFTGRCDLPPTGDGVFSGLPQEVSEGRGALRLLAGPCATCRSADDNPPKNCRTVPAAQCFDMFIGHEAVDRHMAKAVHLLTPGMLADWEGRAEEWGFTPDEAQSFFGESTSRLVLLETGTDENWRRHLEAFEEYTGLASDVEHITLDHLRLFLRNLVLEWRLEQAEASGPARRDADRRLADYAMALDLLGRLAATLEEERVTAAALDMFEAMFAPRAVHFFPTDHDGKPTASRPTSSAPAPEVLEGLDRKMANTHLWLDTGDGFLLRVSHAGQDLGVIAVDGLTFPHYGAHYLNLAVTLTPVLGLALSNARTFGQLKETEAELRRYQDELEKIVAERTAELVQEIGVRKEAEVKLHKWGQVFEHAEWGVMVGSADGKTLELMNPAFARMHGYEVHELLGRPITEVYAPEVRSELPEAIRIAHETGHHTWETLHLRKDGSTFPVLVDITTVKDSADNVLYRVVNVLDITERKAAEERLRFTQFSVENAADAIFWLNPDASFIYVNQAACDYLGYSKEELLSMSVIDVNPHFPREAWQPYWESLKAEGVKQFESSLQRKDGTTFPVEISANFVAYEGKEYDFAFVRDISDRKEAENQVNQTIDALTHSNVELERFAYVASHDLQEPIRMLVTYSQMLSRRYAEELDDDASDYLDFIVTSAKRMQALVRDLLAYSRVTSHGIPFTSVKIPQVIKAVQENLRAAISESGARIETGDLPVVLADEIQLIELFQNLVGNAIKFRRPDSAPQVRITARRDGMNWEFSVTDNGIGMETGYLEQIFVIFKRLHTEQAYPGTGIGLALVKRIVERHGGQIWVTSTVGEGTTFRFTLPATDGETD